MKAIARWLLRKLGWIPYPLPTDRPLKSVICVAPHTSNTDFLLGKLYYWSVGSNSQFLMKREWFFFPLGWLLRKMGGIPIDRSRKGDTVEKIAQHIQKQDSVHIAITPEGTRSYTDRWHQGFYFIAQEAGVPIEIAIIDYSTKSIGIVEAFHPTGDLEADMAYIRSKYNKQQAKYPNQFYEHKA